MKCPFCGQYSMTYDFRSMTYTCHQYNATTWEERMPAPLNNGWVQLGWIES